MSYRNYFLSIDYIHLAKAQLTSFMFPSNLVVATMKFWPWVGGHFLCKVMQLTSLKL